MLLDCEDLEDYNKPLFCLFLVSLGFENPHVKYICYFVTGADERSANGGEIPLAGGFRGAAAHAYYERDSGRWLIN